jgi:uncharacterized membrane protein YccF (DUF307 family)
MEHTMVDITVCHNMLASVNQPLTSYNILVLVLFLLVMWWLCVEHTKRSPAMFMSAIVCIFKGNRT